MSSQAKWKLFIFVSGIFIGIILLMLHHFHNRSSYKDDIFRPKSCKTLRGPFYNKNRENPVSHTITSDDGQSSGGDTSDSGRVRVMCMVFTVPDFWRTRTAAVINTWGLRCDVVKYFYSKGDFSPPSDDFVALDLREGRANLTNKTIAALRWSIKHFRQEVDWFLKADDDTYVIYENLVGYLSKFTPGEPHYVGVRNFHQGSVYAQGGAYLVNSLAAETLTGSFRGGTPGCVQKDGVEDMEVAACLRAANISVTDATEHMFSTEPLKMIEGWVASGKTYSFNRKSITDYAVQASSELISMHYVSPERMYFYDYLLYHVSQIR